MIEIVQGDCLDTLRALRDECVDAVVTDPPYGLSKEPDVAEVLGKWLAGEDYVHRGGGFMGKSWDSFVPGPSVWREVLRVLKPGGHALVFFGTRTYDLGCMALRLAGFEIRDQLAWMYATGFPKSLDVSKAIDKAAGAERVAVGPGRWNHVKGDNAAQSDCLIRPGGQHIETAPATEDAERWSGWGTALKPAQEPLALVRKPLVGTVAANVLQYGTGGLNVDGCRIGTIGGTVDRPDKAGVRTNEVYGVYGSCKTEKPDGLGRWPANVILDPEAGAMLDAQTGTDRGASRFFYCPKASKAEREAGLEHLRKVSAGELTGGRKEGSAGLDNPRAGAGRTSSGRANTHPTVKPVELMRYLVRLITPPGGTVLDPYAGSGTTGIACKLEGFHHIGCEFNEEYVAIARARIAAR